MGPLTSNYQAQPSAAAAPAEIYHFAHHHPLQLSYNNNPQSRCSACTHPISNRSYVCQPCNYHLHVTCSKMPQQLQHPIDNNKNHELKLLPKPVYSEGKFRCDACGHHGSGFSYNCEDCRIDLHVLCSALPPLVSVPGHQHQLARMFASPYAKNEFMCNVCMKPGSKTWLYHCGSCQYDVHLGCIRVTIENQLIKMAARSTSYPPPQANINGYGHHQPVLGRPASYQSHQFYNNQPVGRPGGGQYMDSILNGAIEGMSSAVAQNFGNMFFGGFVGGDGFDFGGFDVSGGMDFSF